LREYWHYIALIFILVSVATLTRGASPLSVAAGMALLILVYAVAAGLYGKTWALLPVIMFGFAPPFLGTTIAAPEKILTSLALLLAVAAFEWFMDEPEQWRLIGAGVALGLALIAHPLAILLVPLYTGIALAALITRIGVEWEDTAPHDRRRRFTIRTLHDVRAIAAIFALGIAVAYAAYISPIGLIRPIGLIDDAPMIVGWLTQNKALAPLGSYLGNVARYAETLPSPNLAAFKTFATRLPLPLLALFIIAAGAAAARAAQSAVLDIIGRTPVLTNYIATNVTGFTLQLFAALFIIVGVASAGDGTRVLLLFLPPLSILAGNALKNWFGKLDDAFIRNAVIRVLVFANNLASMSVKALVLAGLLIWHAATALIAAPNFAAYKNLIGAILG
ncbi:MAG: hypothetical protein HYT82_01515, partial [Candidatus Harrisonbacteria bacterium]|nr:hypothetical protein [Candidatus Harrisonbacteria bacterium]